MSHNITVQGGTSVRLPTAGKYCEQDIIVTAEGGAEDLNAVLTEQEGLIDELKTVLKGKASGGTEDLIDAIIDRSVTEISSNISTIGYHAFDNCTKLVSANFPNVTTVAGYGFQNCSSLKNITLPKVQGINGYGFYGCTSLEDADFPSIRSVGNYAFRKCAALTKIDLYQTYTLNVYAFYECTNLETIILRKTGGTICTLAAANVLQNTKIAAGTGYIYVPSSLVENYKSATNWSTYANQIRAIEDYPDICGG